ncbi:MAG: hypothetical protein ACON4H_16785 [Rubripirellula sp.]
MSQLPPSDRRKRKRPKPDLRRTRAYQPPEKSGDVDREHQASIAAEAESKVILSRRFDPILGGGLSLVISVLVIGLGLITQAGASQFLLAIELYLFTDLFINGPHFIASYRVLYSRIENLVKHPIVTIFFPTLSAIFLSYIVYCSYQMDAFDPLGVMAVLNIVAPIVLAWHYTGQSWGTTACFAHLSGFRISRKQRLLIRIGFFSLFVYHIAWAYNSTGFVQQVLSEDEAGDYLMQSIMSLCRLLVAVGFIAGLYGFWQMSHQAARQVPVRTWLPWAATFSWYVMLDFNPAAFFLLQFFHAFQYLMFPMRVELNEYTPKTRRSHHMIAYYVILVALGYIAFEWSSFDAIPKELIPAGTAVMMIINLHHYFIDAVIWKIREPEVRQALFGHLSPSSSS